MEELGQAQYLAFEASLLEAAVARPEFRCGIADSAIGYRYQQYSASSVPLPLPRTCSYQYQQYSASSVPLPLPRTCSYQYQQYSASSVPLPLPRTWSAHREQKAIDHWIPVYVVANLTLSSISPLRSTVARYLPNMQ
jgi:hypothetical protein